MNFKPIDEMSLRHLFSSDAAKRTLGLAYIGPVLDQTGQIDPSPDALILDMRKSPYRVRRCEFKFAPTSKDDFSHNGKFEVAIVWTINSPATMESLRKDLYAQNGCEEIIALDEVSYFHKLPTYDLNAVSRNHNIESVSKIIVNSTLPQICALYIAAKAYPQRIDLERVKVYLSSLFTSVAQMRAQGRANVVTAFVQTNPPLLKRMFGGSYEWNIDFDNITSAAHLAEIIEVNFKKQPPTESDIRGLIDNGMY
jgi:hypothetical protein